MAFKKLNDGYRRRGLVPFLEAAEYLVGHVAALAVTKSLFRLSTAADTLDLWKTLHGVQARWDPRAFEEMARVAHIFALLTGVWSAPGMHISWLTDDDLIVANPGRLQDMQQLAARLSALYVPHQLGEFMLNTTSVDPGERSFEDLASVADLAAGMLAESLAGHDPCARGEAHEFDRILSPKSDIIANWFAHNSGSLKKTAVLIDGTKATGFGVAELELRP